MPTLLKLTELGAGVPDLVFISTPKNPAYNPMINSIVVKSAGDILYSQLIGNDSAEFIFKFTEEYPLKYQDYLGGYNPVTRVQTSTRQCLCNIYENIAFGALRQITAIIGDGRGNIRSFVVNIMNYPSLGFTALDDGDFIGVLRLRVWR
jgi:hypothetical protein